MSFSNAVFVSRMQLYCRDKGNCYESSGIVYKVDYAARSARVAGGDVGGRERISLFLNCAFDKSNYEE